MTAPPPEEMSFEQIIAELEGLVGQLESDELALEQALTLYERGVRLAVKADGLLQGAEQRIEALRITLAEGAQNP